MGQSACSAIMEAESMELAITVDLVPEEKAIGGIPLAKDIEAFFEAILEVTYLTLENHDTFCHRQTT